MNPRDYVELPMTFGIVSNWDVARWIEILLIAIFASIAIAFYPFLWVYQAILGGDAF